jgi:hypothetical protein
MAEHERHARVRRFDLEERPRPRDDRERGALVPHAQNFHDALAPTVKGHFSRPAIEPIGSNADLQRFDSDHRHFAAPFGAPCELRSPGTGAVNACSISAGA